MASDKAEAEKARTQISKSAETAKRQPAFKKAFEAKDTKTMASLLVRAGAPGDVTVTPSGGSNLTITVTCCRKKKWGPVTVVIGI